MDEYLVYHANSLLKLKKVYSKICNQLDIDHFGYAKVYNNSSYFLLCNDDEILSDYVHKVTTSKIFCQSFLGIEKFNNRLYYFTLWPVKPETYSMEIYTQHKYWNGLSMISFKENYMEAWFGLSKLNNVAIINLYEQDHYRKKFLISADYFDKERDLLIESINLEYLPKFYNGYEFTIPFESQINEIEKFKKEKELLLNCYYPKGIQIKVKDSIVKLTTTEILVLGFLAQGYSSKQIANIMENSPKTIECHKDGLKVKTGYNIKSDLIKLYNDQLRFLVE